MISAVGLTDELKKALEGGDDQKLTALLREHAEALIEVADAANGMFEPTVDRNVARRRMERLRVALARLDHKP
jgi:hypothetical protein